MQYLQSSIKQCTKQRGMLIYGELIFDEDINSTDKGQSFCLSKNDGGTMGHIKIFKKEPQPKLHSIHAI